MYCRKCGAQLRDGTDICENCGTKFIHLQQEGAEDAGSSGQSSEKVSFSTDDFDFRKMNKDQRVDLGAACIGFMALIPFLFGIMKSIFGALTYSTWFPPFSWLHSLAGFMVKASAFLALAAAAVLLVFLVMRYLKRQDKNNEMIIVAAVVSLLTFLSAALRLAEKASFFRGILMITAVVLGMGIFDKVLVKKAGLEGKFTLAEDVKLYSEQAKARKEAQKVQPAMYTDPNIPAYEKTPEIEEGESYFDGTGVDCFGQCILAALITMCSCGIAFPWAVVMIYKWLASHTVIEGKRQSFTGSATDLFGHYILWWLLSIITCGLFSFYTTVAVQKWVVSHTTYQGREIVGGRPYPDSVFDGSFAEYIGASILSTLISLFSCGIAGSFGAVMISRWAINGTVIGGERYFYDGTGGDFFGTYIVNILLSGITCGIYLPWALCKFQDYHARHTHVNAMAGTAAALR